MTLMKNKYVLAILLIASVGIAGCTGQGTTNTPDNSPQDVSWCQSNGHGEMVVNCTDVTQAAQEMSNYGQSHPNATPATYDEACEGNQVVVCAQS